VGAAARLGHGGVSNHAVAWFVRPIVLMISRMLHRFTTARATDVPVVAAPRTSPANCLLPCHRREDAARTLALALGLPREDEAALVRLLREGDAAEAVARRGADALRARQIGRRLAGDETS
jgi:hypothetical protein